jgi:hypothetical protein
MRRRDLIKRLKDNRKRLRSVSVSGLFLPIPETTQQQKSERRLALLHGLENLLPEIIEKLEDQ